MRISDWSSDVCSSDLLSPFPEPPSLAFAQTVIGRDLPLPVGLLFHTVYVTFWVAIFVRYFPRRDILTALGLAAGLWLVILVVFFPIVGWGFAGLAVSPKLIPASFVPHLLFGLLLWALDKYLPSGSGTASRSEEHRVGKEGVRACRYR